MKIMRFLSFLLVAACCVCSCSSEDKNPSCDPDPEPVPETYPVRTQLSEGSFTGAIAFLPNPPSVADEPILPALVIGLKSAGEEYILTCDGHWQVSQTITIAGETYSFEEGDEIQATGTAYEIQLSASVKYFELEIETIGRLNPPVLP